MGPTVQKIGATHGAHAYNLATPPTMAQSFVKDPPKEWRAAIYEYCFVSCPNLS